MKISVTARDLHEIAKDRLHDAHEYLWCDGAFTWDIVDLSDEIEDEAILGKGEDSELVLTACGLTDRGIERFYLGFCYAAPDCYDYENDSCVSNPWCAPWTCSPKEDWFDGDLTAYEMGEAWARFCVEHLHMEEYFSDTKGAPYGYHL